MATKNASKNDPKNASETVTKKAPARTTKAAVEASSKVSKRETARKAHVTENAAKTVKLRKASKLTGLNSDVPPVDTGKAEKTPVVNKVVAPTVDTGSVIRRATLQTILGEMSDDQLAQLERWAIERRKSRAREDKSTVFTPKHLNRADFADTVIGLRNFLSRTLRVPNENGVMSEININSDTDIRRAIDAIPTLAYADAANAALVHLDPTVASLASLCTKVNARVADEKKVAKMGRVS